MEMSNLTILKSPTFSITKTFRKVLADFDVCDEQFIQIEGNGRKLCHIKQCNTFSNSVYSGAVSNLWHLTHINSLTDSVQPLMRF